MNITDHALSSLEKTGISISIILLVAAAIFVYYQVQQIKLTNLRIRLAEKDLGLQSEADSIEQLINKLRV